MPNAYPARSLVPARPLQRGATSRPLVGPPAQRGGSGLPQTLSKASRDLEWVDPVTGERLSIQLRAGEGLLGRLLGGGFEAVRPTPQAAVEAGSGVAA